MYHFTALVTVLSCLLYFYTGILVGKARATYGVKAPATTGNADFERIFRVQMNTLEWMPIFLSGLWLFAIYVSDAIAALIGVVWIIGRIMYLFAYAKAASKRGPGFGIQALAALALQVGALVAIVWQTVHG
jgi:glutathione S-transferase